MNHGPLHEPSDYRDAVLGDYAYLVDQTLAVCKTAAEESLLLALALHGFLFAWPWPTELSHLAAAPCCIDPQTGARLYARYRHLGSVVPFALMIGDRRVAVIVDAVGCSIEQDAINRSRDDGLASGGWVVLRFADNEVWSNADGCARQVCEVLYGFAGGRLAKAYQEKGGNQ